MNRLNPDLKRLIKWARQAPESPPPPVPSGFSARIVGRWTFDGGDGLLALWQRAVSYSAWASALLIVGGLVIFASQERQADTAYDFITAYQVVAQNIAP